MTGLTRVNVRNYRALADVELELGAINVIFGPNGAGKSTLLDSLYFFRDCAIRGVEVASSERDHGIGILWDGASDNEGIKIELGSGSLTYSLSFSMSAGRIDPFPGECLLASSPPGALIRRNPGSDKAALYNRQIDQSPEIKLREPEKLSLGLFLDFNQGDVEGRELDRLLHFVRRYHARSLRLESLKRFGSETSPQTRLWDQGHNAWSVLRNLKEKRNVDPCYNAIMRYMAEAFPFFNDIMIEQIGAASVYASVLENGRRQPILASGASDGVLQLLLLLIALFSEGDRRSVLLFDEPEVSLHPWALAVFARAVRDSAEEWNKQVFLATHSPVLISQFEPEETLVAEVEEGCAKFHRLSEIDELRELLEQYASGALYMSGVVAPQEAGASTATGR